MADVADVYKVSLSSNTSACSTCNLHIDTAGADGLSFNSELDTLHHVGYPNVHLLRDTKAARRAGYIQNNKVTKDFVQRFFTAGGRDDDVGNRAIVCRRAAILSEGWATARPQSCEHNCRSREF